MCFRNGLEIARANPISIPANAIDTRGEDASLKRGGGLLGIAFKAVGVKPTVQRAGAGTDVVRIAGVKEVAPIEEGAGLPFIENRSATEKPVR